jgi:hypothetical protein
MFEDQDREPRSDLLRFEGRLGRADRTPLAAIIVVSVFVLIGIVDPWASIGSSGPPAGRTGPERSAGPSPSPLSAADVAVGDFCLAPGSWRTATIETWRDGTVRVWRAIDPRPASGPDDVAIPVVPAVGSAIPAIGWCAPAAGPERPTGTALVRAWRRIGATFEPVRLRDRQPFGGNSALGALYAPPDPGAATWPDGLVVFRYARVGAEPGWFGIEISGTTPAATASPTPVAPSP